MKKRRRFLSAVLVLMLFAGLAAGCVIVSADDFPVEGEYTLFGVQNGEIMGSTENQEMSSVLILEAGGAGSITMGENSMLVSEWNEADGVVTIKMEDGSTVEAACKNGILELDIYGDSSVLFFYAQQGADTSSYTMVTWAELMEAMTNTGEFSADSKVAKLRESLDLEAGVHLAYVCKPGYLDSVQECDVHGKGEIFYSKKKVQISDIESTSITFFKDGKVYALNPDKMTGMVATELDASFINGNLLRLDPLYAAIWLKGMETEYTEGTKEIDGTTYDTEVFAATEYEPEVTFCFDADGKLAYYLQGPPVVETQFEIGEAEYKIETIDSKVDETLFDISAYTIEENPLNTDSGDSADNGENGADDAAADSAENSESAE